MRSLSIVIPAYNEAATVEGVVRNALAVGSDVSEVLEVIVLDDGSTDETGAIVNRLAGVDSRIRVIHRQRNGGIEASMRALYATANGDYVFLLSADGQWPASALRDMAQWVAKGADLVVGTRPHKRRVYSRYRYAVSKSYDLVARLLGAPVADVGSIKLGRKALLDIPVVSHGVFSEAERVIRAARRGFRVCGCEVPFLPRRQAKASGARVSLVIQALTDSVRLAASLFHERKFATR